MRYRANPVEVDAFAILSVDQMPGELEGTFKLILEGDREVIATPGMTARYSPSAGDYWVIQSDGYVYLNPKHVFERKYSKILEASDASVS